MSQQAEADKRLTVTHWGTYRVTTDNGVLTAVDPVEWDRNPSKIGFSLPGAVQGTAACGGRRCGLATCRANRRIAKGAVKSPLWK